jgi:PAS domain S-box-containing protein
MVTLVVAVTAAAEAERASAALGELVARRQPITNIEVNYRHREGRTVVVEINGTPVFAADGTWAGYHGTSRDITARRSAERALRLRGAALEAAANAIMITDREGRIEWANPAFAELTGWNAAETVGRNPRELLNSNLQSAEFYANLWNTIIAGQVWRGEIVNLRRDGSLRTMDETVTPLRDERGQISHFIAILQDITERKQLDTHLRQSQRMEAIGTLAGGVAHDLNNILAPMMFVSALLAHKLEDPKDQEKLAIIQAGVRRGSEIIRQLLTFSRGQEGERSLVQPLHIIKEMAVMMRETFPREIEIQLTTPESGWPVLADPTQLHQVLLNLSVNARDAMPKGGVLQIATENRQLRAGDTVLGADGKPGPYAVITVRDTGQGIPAEIRPRIFDPFFTTKPIGKGTGLGLSTVLGIVQSHGGYITVDSTPGKGTTFRVYLPAVPEGSVAPFDVIPAAASPSTQHATVLVVDDEEYIRNTMRLVLESQNYRVLTATHGADGLARYLEHRSEIRLVITDLMMPVMNGLALIRSLRVIDPGLPIIASTGLPEVGEVKELQELGIAELLPKPCEASTVISAVERALGRT